MLLIISSIIWVVALLPLLYMSLFFFNDLSQTSWGSPLNALGILCAVISFVAALFSAPIGWILTRIPTTRNKAGTTSLILIMQFILFISLFAQKN